MSLRHVRIESKGVVRALAVTLAALTWLLVAGGQATVLAAVPNTNFVSGSPPNPPEGSVTPDSTPTFHFTSNDPAATFECSVDGGAFAPCSSPHTTAPLSDGPHSFAVRAVNADGPDPTPTARNFTVADPPQTTLTGGPSPAPAVTQDNTPTFTYTSDEAGSTFECSVDGAPFASCGAEGFTSAPLSNGPHSFAVRATDPAGNVDSTPAARDFIVDDGPPQTTINSGPQGTTADDTPTYTFSSDESATTFECRVDAEPFASCTSPHTTPPLAVGAHRFEVRATDADGNVDPTPAFREFTVDDGPPQTTITGGPAPNSITTDNTPTLTFSSDQVGSTFECRVDADAFAPCTSPFTTAPLSDGLHTFNARATDPQGNADPTAAARTFTVNAGAPETTITGGPDGPTSDNTPTFTFSSSEAGSTFTCRVDAGLFAPCSSPYTTAALAAGTHTFQVAATDSAGSVDTTAASRTFTVDTTAPVVTVTTPAQGATYAPGQSVAAAYTCTDTGGSGIASCVGTVAAGSPIDTATQGPKTFTVTGTDNAGNPTTKTVTYTVGKAATRLVAHPASKSLLRITFSATLTRVFDGAPLPGKTVSFRIGGATVCSATTNSTGRASCSAGGVIVGSGTYTATFAGDASNQPSSATARY